MDEGHKILKMTFTLEEWNSIWAALDWMMFTGQMVKNRAEAKRLADIVHENMLVFWEKEKEEVK